MTVLIAGGGIAGMSLALTCHQIGVPVKVFEAVPQIKPIGVGINLQPNAVRELYDLGLQHRLDEIGIQAREWALVGRNGNDIWSEPRGLLAGYRWPQYSVHRGQLQMLLYREVLTRLGPDAVVSGHRVTGYANTPDGVSATVQRPDGSTETVPGALLIGADGIHSALRAKLAPDEGPPCWGGAILWRGTCVDVPVRTGASFVGLGRLDQRIICYPISQPDPQTGKALINWIAEITVDPEGGRSDSDWNKPVDVQTILPHFEDWNYDWLNVPDNLRAVGTVLEYPMVDRNPIDRWVDGRMALMGDAAHVMYPVGSNGASQAIVDARVIGAKLLEHGITPDALLAYQDQLHQPMSELVLRNRGAGPFEMLGIVDDRCGGVFDDINDVVPRDEIEQFMAGYKAAAGFAIDELNNAPPTIAAGARVTA